MPSTIVSAEQARLVEHRVDEGRLPVVDVRDDGDVADVVSCLFHWSSSVVRCPLPVLQKRNMGWSQSCRSNP
jgi:hypothetical protein